MAGERDNDKTGSVEITPKVMYLLGMHYIYGVLIYTSHKWS